MGNVHGADRNLCASFHFERPRLNSIFMHAIKYPLVLVCAGAGYGKTCAVHDFTQKYQKETAWIQLSGRDNIGSRFWENYTNTMSQINEPFARAIAKLGFPDNIDKLNQYLALLRSHAGAKPRIIVMDDFHFIQDPAVIRFVEYAFLNMPQAFSLFLVSRSTPRINIAGMISRGHIFNMNEEDLRFNENELAKYFRMLDIPVHPDSLHEIMSDTEGWAFAINLIARSYRKAPGYGGYLRSAMKTNIFQIMETEIWNEVPENLRHFLIRLSLIGHLSVDLIARLAGNDEGLLAKLEGQTAYVRRDSYINAYLIHPLFLEFLAAKQDMLPEARKQETWKIAGDWCNANGFKIDALLYYEKTGDYKSIVAIFIGSRSQIPYDIACYAAKIFGRAPPEAYDAVPFLASTHLRTVMCQGHWEEAVRLAGYYEERYITLPAGDLFRKLTLSSIYYCWGISRTLMCLTNDNYDFDLYFEKLDNCFSEPFDPGILINRNPGGAWICAIGSSRKGAPEEYLAVLKRSTMYLEHCYTGFETGKDELACGEILFYKGDTGDAETCISRALDIARERKLFGMVHRALFYILRIAVSSGNYARAGRAIKEMRANLDKTDYCNRYIEYDISICWYYCVLGLPEESPDWLKDNFSPYAHASFIENFSNQAKARYCYKAKKYARLLQYIQEMRQRESYLFGRLEMLVMEACIHYKMKNKTKACAVLAEAFEAASPNKIMMPFIEMGKDMRTLAGAALKEGGHGINEAWLKNMGLKASTYAKRLAHIVVDYKRDSGMANNIAISQREREILTDLSRGLSRTEIAAIRGISINTVRVLIKNVYIRLGAENLADAIRIVMERKMI